jgi:lysozyme family protein
MKALTLDTVKPFYKSMYWDKVRCDELPVGVDYAVFDFAVNAGVGRAAKFLQRAVGAVDDGVIGSGTLALVSKTTPGKLLKNFAEQKEAFYNTLAEKNPTQKKFLKGWLARVEHVQGAAESMLA